MTYLLINEMITLVAKSRLESSPGYPIYPLLVGIAFISFAIYGLISRQAHGRGFVVCMVKNPIGFFFLVIVQFLIGLYAVIATIMSLLK
jgi:hypothetical protein